MQFPERFSALPEYAFPRLRALLDAHAHCSDGTGSIRITDMPST